MSLEASLREDVLSQGRWSALAVSHVQAPPPHQMKVPVRRLLRLKGSGLSEFLARDVAITILRGSTDLVRSDLLLEGHQCMQSIPRLRCLAGAASLA